MTGDKKIEVSDNLVSDESEQSREYTESRALLNHFIKAYSSAYTVNLKEDSFKILHMNHAFKQVFTMNGSRADMERFVAEHVHPDDREHVYKMIDRNYIRMRMETESEISFTIREQYNGEERTMHAMIMRGSDPDHIAVGFMDVTDEIKKQKEISDRLEAANKAKSTFLFNMSHDIRTPMNAIIGFTELAKKHIDDKERVLDCLEKVKTSGEHLLSLINDVLDMSRVESGKVELDEKPISLGACINDVISMVNSSAEDKGIRFCCQADAVSDLWISADRLQLTRILINIISNAVKYTESGGSVMLDVSKAPLNGDGKVPVTYTVKDNGIGMSEEFLENIFEPFARAESSTVSGVVGTGLGMAITKSLVELMSGNISVKSKLGEGTEVIVSISHRLAEPERECTDGAVESYNLQGKKVLLVEDNELNREIAADILEESGMIIDTAEDGDIAVRKVAMAANGTYDVILMDIQMPKMNGYDAAGAIRKLPSCSYSELPIIAMTANAFDEDKKNAFAAGMNGHIAKPINVPILLKTLSDIVKQQK